jgi:fluoride exporter
MDTFKAYAAVGIGSALGGMARLWISTLVARRWGDVFPWGTLAVNVTGSFLIGLLAGLLGPDGRWPGSRLLMLFFGTGLCGGYTTFSAFSLQVFQLAREGHWLLAASNIVLSLFLCLGASLTGYLTAQIGDR